MCPAFLFHVPFCLTRFSMGGGVNKAQDRYGKAIKLGRVVAGTSVEMSGDSGVTVMYDVIVVTVEPC